MRGQRRRLVRATLMSTCIALTLACSPAVAAQPCENEVLRSELHSGELPDCRAYEMVTPPSKGSDAVRVWAISENGSRVIGASMGVFAGSPSNEFQDTFAGAVYAFTPSLSGWTAEALAPPAWQFPSNRFEGVSTPGLASTLWLLRTPEQPNRSEADFYLRTASGTFVPIGPTQSVVGEDEWISFAGASKSLDHVLFSMESVDKGVFLWPGDRTFSSSYYPSLYEYTGVEKSEPVLVGVKNEGELDGSPHVNDGAEQISQCGTELGGEATAYNAVSASGATVFFTARALSHCNPEEPGTVAPAVNELYARIDGARTVDISEPTSQHCEACNTTSGLSEGLYQGASESGGKVFFTTEQRLLPGARGNNLYEYELNESGRCPARPEGCITRVSSGATSAEVYGVARISEDGSHIYYVAGGALTGPNAEGKSPVAEGDNLYVYDTLTGQTRFIATLSENDHHVWQEIDRARPVEATPDGDFLVFTSVADLTPGDTSTVAQVFEYDAQTERLQRVSVGQDGYNGDGNTTEEADEARIGTSEGLAEASLPVFWGGAREAMLHAAARALSNDGSRVFFESADALTPQTNPGLPNNVYEWEREGAGGCAAGHAEGCVYLISDGRDDSSTVGGASVRLIATDASGDDVFFTTADRLVPRDTDTQLDVYDARIEGGFAEPPTPAECAGSACQGPVDLAPSTPSVQTATREGETILPKAASSPPPATQPKPKPKVPTPAQELRKALAQCRAERERVRRSACEAAARRRYAHRPKTNAHKAGRR
jgi:hypothetical protein